MSPQPRDHWLDVWGLVAFSILLWIWQRATLTSSSLWAAGAFLLAILSVWSLTSRRLIRQASGAGDLPAPSDDAATVQKPPDGVAAEPCPVCARALSDSDRRCTCGAPILTAADRQRLRGPRGWVAVFRFATLVLLPSYIAAFLATSLGNASELSTGDWLRFLPEVLLAAGPAPYGVFVSTLLAYERPEGVRHVRTLLLLNVTSDVAFIGHVGLFDGARAAVESLRSVLPAMIGAYLWMRYFRQSRRVLLTYGPDALRSGVSLPTLTIGSIAIVLVVLVPFATLRAFWPSAELGWTRYAPGGFRLEMPGSPELSEESFAATDGTVSVLRTATSETWDGMTFSVSHEDLPPDADLSDQAAILDAMRDGAIASAVLQQGQAIVVQGVPGLEFVAHGPNRQFSLAGRVFLVDRRTIALMAVTPGMRTSAHVRAADRFLNSFAIAGQ